MAQFDVTGLRAPDGAGDVQTDMSAVAQDPNHALYVGVAMQAAATLTMQALQEEGKPSDVDTPFMSITWGHMEQHLDDPTADDDASHE